MASIVLTVISTPVGYVKKYIVPGFNGYLYEKRNAEDLAKKLRAVIPNRELRKTLGNNARETIQLHYRWNQSVDKIRAILYKYAKAI
jgi:glycosyltransferase involved in cell wall biosynthesis